MTREYCQPHFTRLQEQMYLFICFNYGMTWGNPYLFALFMAWPGVTLKNRLS